MAEPRLTFLAIDVLDLATSVSFYRLILGAPLHETSHDAELDDDWYGGSHAATSWTRDAYLHFAIYPMKQPVRPRTTGAQIGFQVSRFDEVHAKIVNSGAQILQPPRDEPWGKTARYLDPDGNIVSITEGGA